MSYVPFDNAAEWMISYLVEELLQSFTSNNVAGLSSALLRLFEAFPSAPVWHRMLSHPSPPVIVFLVETVELYSGIVEWTSQADVLNLTGLTKLIQV